MGTVSAPPPGSHRALAGTMGFNTWHTTAPPPSFCFASCSRDPCVFPCQPQLEQAVSLHTCRDGEPALRLTLQSQEPGKASAPFRSGRRCFLLGLPGSPPPSAGLLCSAPDGPGSLTSCPQPGSLNTGAVSPGAWAGRPSSFPPPPLAQWAGVVDSGGRMGGSAGAHESTPGRSQAGCSLRRASALGWHGDPRGLLVAREGAEVGGGAGRETHVGGGGHT